MLCGAELVAVESSLVNKTLRLQCYFFFVIFAYIPFSVYSVHDVTWSRQRRIKKKQKHAQGIGKFVTVRFVDCRKFVSFQRRLATRTPTRFFRRNSTLHLIGELNAASSTTFRWFLFTEFMTLVYEISRSQSDKVVLFDVFVGHSHYTNTINLRYFHSSPFATFYVRFTRIT